VAIDFSRSIMSLIFKIVTQNQLQRGVDLPWLSNFPSEKKLLFPPLTYMQTGKSQEVQIEGSHFTIVEVHTTQAKFYTAAVPHDVPLRVVGGGCGVAVVVGGMC